MTTAGFTEQQIEAATQIVFYLRWARARGDYEAVARLAEDTADPNVRKWLNHQAADIAAEWTRPDARLLEAATT